LALGGVMAAVMLGSWRALQPPVALSDDAPATRFSEGRARVLVRRLAEDIGLRVNGTPAHARAAELLAGELRRIPGLEVETQSASGTQVYRSSQLPAFVYRTLNVVARLPGRSPDAILLDAHFDTLTDSVGAADDAAGVAAIVEAMRVLAGEAAHQNTIIVNLNGGEEAGLFGAAAFLQHRWATDVRAYLYLEALPGGRAGLFGAGPGASSLGLAKAYARVAPAPLGNVVGQDLVQSGLLPHNGDFTPFHEAGLRGLDVAMTGDGWAYHTALDRLARLQPGGLQHIGDTAVAVVRALAAEPLPPERAASGGAGTVVFYDLLGMTMVAYSAVTARGLALAALVLAAVALGLAIRRQAISARATLGALAWTTVAFIAGVLGAVAAGLLLSLGLGRPHGWFSAPALVLPAFAAPALAATFGVQGLWRRRALRKTGAQGDTQALVASAGALVFWSLWLALTAVRGVGAGYLALHWVWPAALAMIAAVLFPRWRAVLALASLIPGAVVTIELGVLFLTYFLPITGIIPAPRPFDAPVAALVGIVVAAVAPLACASVHHIGGFWRASLACVAVTIVGLVATAVHAPYTEQRPKRIRLTHVIEDSNGSQKSALLLASGDALPLGPVLSSVPEFVPARPDWPSYETWAPPSSHQAEAPPPKVDLPRLDLTTDAYDPATDQRRLTFRVTAPGTQMRLGIPSARLLAWSLGAPPAAVLAVDGKRLIHLEGLDDSGAELAITVRGRRALPIELRAVAREPLPESSVQDVVRRLPPWTTTTTTTFRLRRLEL